MAKKFSPDDLTRFPQFGVDQDFSRLVTSLNDSKLIKTNPALYQTILYLVRNTNLSLDKIWKFMKQLQDLITAGSSVTQADYVVLSDGGVDAATQPINNGGGQFIYTAYNP